MIHSSETVGARPSPKPLERVIPRQHLCGIVGEERCGVDARFLKDGIDRGERALFQGNAADFDRLEQALADLGVDVATERRTGKLHLQGLDETLLRGGDFAPSRALDELREAIASAVSDGFRALRVAGGAPYPIRRSVGIERLLAYEAEVDEIIAGSPASALCQYERQLFPAADLLAGLQAHPYVLDEGTVCRNHWYLPSRASTEACLEQRKLDGMLRLLREREQFGSELERRLFELEQANEELRQFVHVASHDLREPVRMIRCYVRLLAARYRGHFDDDADEFIHFAVEGADQLSDLIDSLVAYARSGRPSNPPEPVDCNQVMNDVTRNLDIAIRESGATVSWDSLPKVWGQRSQLVQLFQNLVTNGIKFRGAASPRLAVACERKGHDWLLRVRDNGIGIGGEDRERVFGLFQRLHERGLYPGTGVGLSICRKVVERHGGKIWVEAPAAGGSEFCFTLPAVL